MKNKGEKKKAGGGVPSCCAFHSSWSYYACDSVLALLVVVSLLVEPAQRSIKRTSETKMKTLVIPLLAVNPELFCPTDVGAVAATEYQVVVMD